MSALTQQSPHRLKDHYVICNWSPRILELLKELNKGVAGLQRRATVIVTTGSIDEGMLPRDARERACFEDVMFYPGDPTQEDVLRRVNFHDAHSVIVLARPDLGDQADARTLLTLFSMLGSLGARSSVGTVGGERAVRAHLQDRKRERNALHVIAEIVDVASYAKFRQFESDRDVVIEFVRAESVRTRVLAQAARTQGLGRFFQDLLSYGDDTNEVYAARIPDAWFDATKGQRRQRTFPALCRWLMAPAARAAGVAAMPVGIWRPPHCRSEDWFGTRVNPGDEVLLAREDRVLVLCLNQGQVPILESYRGPGGGGVGATDAGS